MKLFSATIPFTNQELSLDTKNILTNLTNVTLALGVLASILYMAPGAEAGPFYKKYQYLSCNDPKLIENTGISQRITIQKLCQDLSKCINKS
jgi:hypothetical protein